MRPLTEGEATFLREAGDVFQRVEMLHARARSLGVAAGGFEGVGPHETELSRDVSAALFVAWSALQATLAFVQYGGELSSNFREDMHRCRNVLRGGRPDGAPNSGRIMAVQMARQAIGYAHRVGFFGQTADDAVAHIRQTYANLFGSVFTKVPAASACRGP
jgi:hypothetical protein